MIEFPIVDSDFVENLIPQKNPFVMIDKLLQFSEKQVEAGLEIKENNLFFYADTFQEAGLIEHMAQTVALHTGYDFYLQKKEPPVGYIGSISSIEIERLPLLGENLETTAIILQEFAGITLVKIDVRINGEIIASGQMKTVLAS